MRAGAVQFGLPSLRSMFAWAFFRAIDFITALILAAVIVSVIAIPIMTAGWLLMCLLRALQLCGVS